MDVQGQNETRLSGLGSLGQADEHVIEGAQIGQFRLPRKILHALDIRGLTARQMGVQGIDALDVFVAFVFELPDLGIDPRPLLGIGTGAFTPQCIDACLFARSLIDHFVYIVAAIQEIDLGPWGTHLGFDARGLDTLVGIGLLVLEVSADTREFLGCGCIMATMKSVLVS